MSKQVCLHSLMVQIYLGFQAQTFFSSMKTSADSFSSHMERWKRGERETGIRQAWFELFHHVLSCGLEERVIIMSCLLCLEKLRKLRKEKVDYISTCQQHLKRMASGVWPAVN